MSKKEGFDISKYYIAVDGGGSKTEFYALNTETGQNVRYIKPGSSNNKISDSNAVAVAILEGIFYIFKELGISAHQVNGLVMGMSGVDSQEDHNHYMDIGGTTGVARERIYVCNDSELAFYAQGSPPGLCMIAGTGSTATGIGRDMRKVRVGGWGSPMSDEGSGGWIGIRVLRDILRYCDGYGEYRDVFEPIREHFQADSFESLPGILSKVNMTQIAGAAKLLMDHSDLGDPYSLEIVNCAGRWISEIAYSAYHQLGFRNEDKIDVVMAGSLYKSSTYKKCFMESFVDKVAVDNLRFCEATTGPVEGGISLARIMFGS